MKGILKRRAPLRRVSAKRALVNLERNAFVKEQLERRQHCEAGESIFRLRCSTMDAYGDLRPFQSWECHRSATELHEPLSRARAPGAETILDVGNSVAICRRCHEWVHMHPALATSIGLMRSNHG